jgi:hypothetical protein
MILTYKRRFDDIKGMSIADGLKAILVEYGFSSERLIRLSPSDLASILGIDEYVAKGSSKMLQKNRFHLGYLKWL